MSTPDFDFDELTRLASIYTKQGSTNPIAILRRSSALEDADRALLDFIVKNSPAEKVATWTKEAGPGELTPGMGKHSAEELENVAKRDFKAVDNMALLRFRMQNTK